MPEHQVVVVFDVTAVDQVSAATAIAAALNRGAEWDRIAARMEAENGSRLESWWFPEAELKSVDGNDNAAMVLVPDDDPLQVEVLCAFRPCEFIAEDLDPLRAHMIMERHYDTEHGNARKRWWRP